MRWPFKRGLFQIHLLTAIVVSVAAGGVIKLNMGRTMTMIAGYEFDGNVYDPVIGKALLTGWPYRAVEIKAELPMSINGMTFPKERWNILWKEAAADLGVALLMLAAVAVLCEFLLRRFHRRLQPNSVS